MMSCSFSPPSGASAEDKRAGRAHVSAPPARFFSVIVRHHVAQQRVRLTENPS